MLVCLFVCHLEGEDGWGDEADHQGGDEHGLVVLQVPHTHHHSQGHQQHTAHLDNTHQIKKTHYKVL